MSRIQFGLVITLFFSAIQAQAIVDLRFHYGPWSGKPKKFNQSWQEDPAVSHPEISGPNVMGADLILDPPMVPFVLGARYEIFDVKENFTAAGVPGTSKIEANRLSALFGFRFINTKIAYIGLLGHYGLKNELNYTVTSGIAVEYKEKMEPSYGVGIEAGTKLLGVMIGLEAGYTQFKAKSATDPNGDVFTNSAGEIVPLDFSGPYFKALLGISI